MQVNLQKQVEFYDDRLTAAQTDDGRIYVSISEVCAVLGLNRSAQQRRLQDHDVLGDGFVRLTIDTAGEHVITVGNLSKTINISE